MVQSGSLPFEFHRNRLTRLSAFNGSTFMTIYIGTLSFQAEQEHLFDLFSEYGEVKNCSLPLDRETGRKRGFAFVEMISDDDEQKAIDDLQDVEWMGRMIRVSKATPRERSGGPRGGGYRN